MESSWAALEMSGANIGDGRRVNSLIRICDQLSRTSGLSFSASVGPASRQAATRMFSEKSVSAADLLVGHFASTAQRCNEKKLIEGDNLILVAQDTTSFDYTGHSSKEGLGPITTADRCRGLLSHCAMAMTEQGLPLGVVHLKIWARDLAAAGSRHKRSSRATSEKESQKWLDGLADTQKVLGAKRTVLLIQDREGDLYDLFNAPRSANIHLLVRSARARYVGVNSKTGAGGDQTTETAQAVCEQVLLKSAIAASPVLGSFSVRVPRKPHKQERSATLELRIAAVELSAPKNREDLRGRSVPVWVVQAQELAPQKTDKPEMDETINWLLITTMPILTASDGQKLVEHYTKRWQIERLHYTLKSGCRVERLQFDDAHSLTNALAVYYVVAWRLLQMTHLARLVPEQPATQTLSANERAVLSAVESKDVETIADAVVAIAKMGGYEPSKNGRPPGVKVLWNGLRRLEAMVEGWLLAKQIFDKKL